MPNYRKVASLFKRYPARRPIKNDHREIGSAESAVIVGLVIFALYFLLAAYWIITKNY